MIMIVDQFEYAKFSGCAHFFFFQLDTSIFGKFDPKHQNNCQFKDSVRCQIIIFKRSIYVRTQNKKSSVKTDKKFNANGMQNNSI